MDPLENLIFFKAKVNCHINQIKTRKLYVSTSTYNIINVNNIWMQDNYYRVLHPLSLFIEGKKILKDKQPIFHISRLLDIEVSSLRAFNAGLKKMEIYSFNKLGWYLKIKDKIEKNTIKKYFVFGRSVRDKLDQKRGR